MSKKTFLITGATGFIGQHLCHKLVKEGHQVVALVRTTTKIAALPKHNLQILRGDLSSFKNLLFSIPTCDVVIHLAGTVTAKKESDYNRDNHIAVVDMFHCLARQNWKPQRILFCSSIAAVGPSTHNAPMTETDPELPIDAYGRAKLSAEQFLLGQKEIPVTVFRPPPVIGPGDPNVLNLYKMGKLGLGFVPRHEQFMSFVSVFDLVDAVVTLSQDVSHDHHTYFVAHEQPVTAKDLWKEVEKTLAKKIRIIPLPAPLIYLGMLANGFLSRAFKIKRVLDKKYYDQLKAPAWVYSSDSIKKDFGWHARQSLSEIFRLTANDYKTRGWI